MELPRRARGDELLKPGEMLGLRKRLQSISGRHDLASVIACAFDHRTRMLPFIYADLHMAPAGVRAIGSALADAGFAKTRIVLQQWNRNFRPSQMRLDGRIPDIFMISSMQLHAAACSQLIRDACRIERSHRPLIIVGGPKVIYEPWTVFGTEAHDPWGADVAVTGEEFVLLSLLEALLAIRGRNERLRATFARARDNGLLDDIPGLVYARCRVDGVAEELVDTGIQRLVGDLDELPHPVHGYRLLEPPSRGAALAAQALPADRVRKYSPISSLVLTYGCKFACPYCPIPAYNQRQHRVKSGERIADEMVRLGREFNLRSFFGADDNFFNHEKRTLDIVEALARVRRDISDPRKRFRWSTEVTVHDTLKLREHLPLVRRAGARSLWLGVEDLTATLVNKGQGADKTTEAFRLLRQNDIHPMPMMMHHDAQPLVSRAARPFGLINQVRLLRKAGAVSMQILMLVPATGSKLFTETYTSGMAYDEVGGRRVEEHMLGGNYVIASHHPRPWRKQINILLGYAYFYNPPRLLLALVRPKTRLHLADAIWQGLGMWGLAQTVRRTFGWVFRLRFGEIRRKTAPPMNRIPMRAVDGGPAPHALPLAMGSSSPDAERRSLPHPAGVFATPLPILAWAR